VIIDDLNVVGVSVKPNKAETPLIVDSYAMLSLPIAAQSFQTIPWRRYQVTEFGGAIQLTKLAARDGLNCPKAPATLSTMKPPGLGASERPDH